MRQRTAVLAAFMAMIGWTMLPDDGGDESTGDFETRLQAGAPCSELFGILNEVDASPDRILQMHDQLRAVGCYSSDSERIDSEPID